MRERYGGWSSSSQIQPTRGCSYIWREICAHAPIVLDHIRCMVGDGSDIVVSQDAWISSLPLSRWPSFVSTEVGDTLRVRDLLTEDGRFWRVQEIQRLFGSELALRICAIPIPIFRGQDTRVWGPSCLPRASAGSLFELFRERPERRCEAAWIWRLPIHPRLQLFIWKMVWNRLPTRSLLRRRGMDIPTLCPLCGDQDETTEHVILSCPRARSVWDLAGSWEWQTDGVPQLQHFLLSLQRSQAQVVPYIAYQIWLARNRTIFEGESWPAHRIFLRAHLLASEFHRQMSTFPLDTPGSWDSHAATAAAHGAILVSWEPPPPGFIKVNFDGSVRDAVGGAGYVIRDEEGRLLAAGGSHLYGPSVPEAELRAAWAGISRAIQQLQADRVFIEGDSATVISWIRGSSDHGVRLPLIRDICRLLREPSTLIIRHVYREANSAADWIASYVAQHSGDWVWSQGDAVPQALHGFLLYDLLGCSRTRFV